MKGRIQMEAIVARLKKIDAAAEAILGHTAAEKQKMQEQMQKKILDFDKNLAQKTEEKINAQRDHMDARIETEIEKLTADTEAQILSVKSSYEQNQAQIAGEIFEKITGRRWQA